MEGMIRLCVPVIVAITLVSLGGCKKKQVAVAVPTAPPVRSPSPTAKMSANPNAINAGDKVVLSWSSTDASSVSIDGIGSVTSSGVKTVMPGASTTYHLVAKGDGGAAEADARVTVNAATAAAKSAPAMSTEEEFRANVRDIFFDYDKANLCSDAQSVLPGDAAYLVSHPGVKVLIGGYGDERGSNEIQPFAGTGSSRASEKRPVERGDRGEPGESDQLWKREAFLYRGDACWQQNRRAGFSLDR